MSTRSGKRIHGSIHENIVKPEDEIVVKSERKTRSRRLKENCDDVVLKSKKRHNYVSYPTDDDQNHNTTKVQANVEIVVKSSKKTLREKDLNVSVKTGVDEVDSRRVIRHTRRTKKFSENIPDDVPVEIEVENVVSVKSKKKNKKNKKKSVTEIDINESEDVVVVPKKSKKKKGKTPKPSKEVPAENFNRSNTSIDSFHSAAGSPIKVLKIELERSNGLLEMSPCRASKRLKADSCEENDAAQTLNDTYEKKSKKIKLSKQDDQMEINNGTLSSYEETTKKKDDTFDKPEEVTEVLNTTFEKEATRKRKSSLKNNLIQELNTTTEKVKTPTKFNKSNEERELRGTRRKSLRSTYDKTDTPPLVLNSTFEKADSSANVNKSYDSDKSRRKSLRSTFDKIESPNVDQQINTTFEKKDTPSKEMDTIEKVQKKSLRSTFDKNDTPTKKEEELNSTFEKINSPNKINSTIKEVKNKRMSTRLSMSADRQTKRMSLNTTFDNPKRSLNGLDKSDTLKLNSIFNKSKDSEQTIINTTFEKSKDSRQSTLNSTFDKETKLNSTFDKPENQSESESKSSLISSDNASNVTFDKSDEISRISITSDDSRTENIVNTTPLLIESSMDESQVEQSPKNLSSSDDSKLKLSATPLKREGTFTKDCAETASTSSNSDSSLNKTPVKRMSLPSPGSTPFLYSKSSQKEKCMLNVTRSIEKSRRSSVVEAPRQTRVMFCSPVNNPVVVMQRQGKIIKSNLKGSNKSFVFDDSATELVRPATRKRSYTQNDAEDVRAKRKRLASDQLQAAVRLSRPRTSSATAKQSEPSTPSKKPATPHKTLTNSKSDAKVSRTKLPNFAALHQKQFAKMESLDECQMRKAKRAKQLLTPTGALAIIEKSSPKARGSTTGEATKPAKEVPKRADTQVSKKTDSEVPKKSIAELPKRSGIPLPKKSETPTKAPKSLVDSFKPGYTRFGFKMNLDVNPFSIPPKTDIKPRGRPNGFLTRQPSQPSLAGATTARREVAKQIVMRERSFTSLSDKRKEKRTMIKGVRTNRRFELQMQMRNVNP